MRVESIIAEGGAALEAIGIHNGGRESRWLLDHVLEKPSSERGSGGDGATVAAADEAMFRVLLRRRLGGEPLQYIMGSTEFYGLELALGPGVLIPRPETERLVDFALENYVGAGPVCDLCTGSGAIAIALAHELGPTVSVWAADLSAMALAYARRNAVNLSLPMNLRQGDLFEPLPKELRFAMITANPPYVSPAAYDALPAEVKEYEPKRALRADDEGMALIRRIAEEAIRWLLPKGIVLCEISSEQGPEARRAFEQAGFAGVRIRRDYTGRDRVVMGRWNGEMER